MPLMPRLTSVSTSLSNTPRNVRGSCLRDKSLSLPGNSGFLLPQTPQERFLYGPGYAFLMSPSGRRDGSLDEELDQSLGLIPYDPPQPPIVSRRNASEAHVIVFGESSGQTFIEANLVDAEPSGDETRYLLPGRTVAGALPSPADDTVSQEVKTDFKVFVGTESKSPRRTLPLQFTCNRCGTRNVTKVNPLAWHSGTVFIECGGCQAKHKMVDHLNVAQDMGLSAQEMDMPVRERLRSLMPDNIKVNPIE